MSFDWSSYEQNGIRHLPSGNGLYTGGEWDSESESAEQFDALVRPFFKIFNEVPGKSHHFRIHQTPASFRIDRILVPRSSLVHRGWIYGPVGVELKRSGVSLGRPLGQLIDYASSSYRIGTTWITPEWFFLWPMWPVSGPLQSVLGSLRCGQAFPIGNKGIQGLTFHSNYGGIATVWKGNWKFRQHNAEPGVKVGSR